MSTEEELDQLTYKINGFVLEVNRVLGAGFLENVCENSFILELKRQGLKVESQVPISVSYKGDVLGVYTAHIMVEDEIILKLKAIDKLQKVCEAQINHYLKTTGIKAGLWLTSNIPRWK